MFDDDDVDDIEDERMFVAESAFKHKRGTKEEIELYEELSLALQLIKDNSFRVEGSRICNGVNFSIVTQYPDGLPLSVGSLFFNISSSFNVQIKKTDLYTNGIHKNPGEMNFQVKIKKSQAFCNKSKNFTYH